MLSESTINLLTNLLNYIFAIPFLILGVIGSVFTIIVFTRGRSFRRNTTTNYLLAGAIVTGIYLPTGYIQVILVYGFDISLLNTSNAACREYTYLRYVTTVAAISFPCWAAFDQFACTSRQAAFRNRWSTRRAARIIIVSDVVFWIIIYIPSIFYSKIINGVCALKPGAYARFNTYVFTPIVYGIGPAVVIIYCTRGTIKHLRSTIIRSYNQRLVKQVRAMIVPQLVILAISGIPFGFQGIYLDITSSVEKDAERMALERFFGQVITIFYHFNYVFTFYIYFYISSEVRKVLRHEILKFIQKARVTPNDAIANLSIRLRPLNSINSLLKC